MLHFRFLLNNGLWGRSAANLTPQAAAALRADMEHRVLLGLKYFGFDVADDVIVNAFKAML